MKRRFWTDAEIATLIARYPNERTGPIANYLGRNERQVYMKAGQLGLFKSPEYLASPAACRLRRGDNIGAAHRFKPGQDAWNRGMKGLDIGGKETRFPKGNKPANHKPVGSTRITVDGYIEVKVAEGMYQWRLLHREVWKQHHGSYPRRDRPIVFVDGNKQNCAISNLECISRATLMKRNTVHNLPKPVALLVQLRGALNRKINRMTGEK